MDVPTLVAEALGDEGVAAHVPLNGDDALYVTGTRTLRYSEEGFLSDESVAEFPHGAKRVLVDERRRKATITMDYGTNGTKEFGVPVSQLDAALHPVLAGVLNANGVTVPGETVKRTFRFSELTIVVTSHRLVKHIGSSVWDDEFEEIPFDSVTGVDIEEGNVSSQFVLLTPARTQRIKAPNESFAEVREAIESAFLAFHDVESLEEFERLTADEEESAEAAVEETADVSFESGVKPLGSSADESTQAGEDLEESGFTAATEKVEHWIDPHEFAEELDELEAQIVRQQETLEAQQAWIDELRELIPDR